MPHWPTIPAEVPYSEAELAFIESQPDGLWPDNQNSNFGQIRKVLCDMIQEQIDYLTILNNEIFWPTSSRYLSLWEELLDLPVAPTGKTDIERRSYIAPRMLKGPFTRARVRSIIESFIVVTFGPAISLVPEGVPLPVGGLPLYSGVFSLIGTYRVYEDIRNFSYAVWIKSSITPDIPRLTRELQRITPAHLTMTIDNTHADVLDYFQTVRSKQPVLYLRDNTGNDSSGYANNATGDHSAIIAGAAANGLIHVNTAGGNTSAKMPGLSSASVFAIPYNTLYLVKDEMTFETWLKLDSDALPLEPGLISGNGHPNFYVQIRSSGKIELTRSGTVIARSTTSLVTGTTYHIVVRKAGTKVSIVVNGVDVTEVVNSSLKIDDDGFTSNIYVGGLAPVSNRVRGEMDEIAFYNYYLSDAQVSDNYQTGIDVPLY